MRRAPFLYLNTKGDNISTCYLLLSWKFQNILETPLERRCQRGTEYMKVENSI